MNADAISPVKDRDGWPIVVGSWVRVEWRPGRFFRGQVTALKVTEKVVEVRDTGHRARTAAAATCTVFAPTEKVRRRHTYTADALRAAGAALTRAGRRGGDKS